MQESTSYKFERLSLNNLNDYIDLFEIVFGYKPSTSDVIDKFNSFSNFNEHIGYIAYENSEKKPVAYYGVFPQKKFINGISYIVAQSGSTMTHPSFRKKGLFKSLAELTYDDAKKRGVLFVYGMPNQYSLQGLKSLGWTFLYKMVSQKIFLPTPSFLYFLFKGFRSNYFKLTTDLTSVPFFKTLKSTEEKNIPDRILEWFDEYSLVLRMDDIYLQIKTDNHVCKVGNIYITSNTSKLTAIKVLIFFILAMMLKNICLITFYCSPNFKFKSFFSIFSVQSESIWYGYLPLSETPPFNINDFSISYGDYDTF